MGIRQQGTGQSDQFDDLIMDPEGASAGPEMGQRNQGYEESPDVEGGDKDAAIEDKATAEYKEKNETFDNIDPNSQLKTLEEKEDKGDEESKKDDEKEEEGKKEESKDGKEDEGKEGEKEEEKVEEEKPEGKTLKLFKDGKKYEIPPEAEIRVKVDGKNEKVTVAELRDHYSGKVAYDKKFSEITEKNQVLTAKEKELTRVQTSIKETLSDVKGSLGSALQDGSNPMEAVNKIVDLLGVDSYDFNKALFDALGDELVTLDQMDEFEQKAYWLEKKTNHLQKRHESLEEKQIQSKAQEERLAKVDQLREAHGVSEDDFVSAFEQLSQMGKQVTPEQVVNYAANLPFVTKSEELLTPYEDQLSDDEFDGMMAKVANVLKSGVSEEDMAAWLLENYEVEDIIEEANRKAGKIGANEDQNTNARQPSQTDLYKSSDVESFSDFNY